MLHYIINITMSGKTAQYTINPYTGRKIKVGGRIYQDLVRSGTHFASTEEKQLKKPKEDSENIDKEDYTDFKDSDLEDLNDSDLEDLTEVELDKINEYIKFITKNKK